MPTIAPSIRQGIRLFKDGICCHYSQYPIKIAIQLANDFNDIIKAMFIVSVILPVIGFWIKTRILAQ